MKYFFNEATMRNYTPAEIVTDETDHNLRNLKVLIEKGYCIESYYDQKIAEDDAGIKFTYPASLDRNEYSLFIDIIHRVVRNSPLYEKICTLGDIYISDNSAEDAFDSSITTAGWSIDFVFNDVKSTVSSDDSDFVIMYHVIPMVTFLEMLTKVLPTIDDTIKVIDMVREIH